MELSTITMPKQEARAKFLEYRRAVRERHSHEDEAIMRGYRALSQGKQIINLRETIRAGGTHGNGLPRLAVARATAEMCYVVREYYGAIEFWSEPLPWPSYRVRSRKRVVRFPNRTFHAVGEAGSPFSRSKDIWTGRSRSVVPCVPPALRPARGLDSMHVLFEADWTVVPHDPALIRHLGGELWVVLAVWDLTELERAVLAGRQ